MCFRPASTGRQRCILLSRPTHTASDASIHSKYISKVRRPRRGADARSLRWNWTWNSRGSRNWRCPPPCRVSLLKHRAAGEWTTGESALAKGFTRGRDARARGDFSMTNCVKGTRSKMRTASVWINVEIPYKTFLRNPTAQYGLVLFLPNAFCGIINHPIMSVFV